MFRCFHFPNKHKSKKNVSTKKKDYLRGLEVSSLHLIPLHNFYKKFSSFYIINKRHTHEKYWQQNVKAISNNKKNIYFLHLSFTLWCVEYSFLQNVAQFFFTKFFFIHMKYREDNDTNNKQKRGRERGRYKIPTQSHMIKALIAWKPLSCCRFDINTFNIHRMDGGLLEDFFSFL